MTDEEAWQTEERLWTGTPEEFVETVSAACLMAFTDPVGIIAAAVAAQNIAELERWEKVEMTERQLARTGPDLVVLAYRGEGQRDLAPVYRAYCTSTYHRSPAGRWLLVQHQQSPIGRRSR